MRVCQFRHFRTKRSSNRLEPAIIPERRTASRARLRSAADLILLATPVAAAVDTNILVHAHREDSEWHAPAVEHLTTLAEGRGAWAIPWPCIHEFLAIVTHPRIFSPPTPLALALDQVAAWSESPTLVLLAESDQHWRQLRSMLAAAKVAGPRIHDARVAALCIEHGVRELWSADRDFSRFPDLTVVNPLVA